MLKNKCQEITVDGIKFVKDEKGELREPRFLMPEKEAYQNSKARIIKRIGYKRFDKDDEMVVVLNDLFAKMFKAYILPTNFQEFKANFYKCKWLSPKEQDISLDSLMQEVNNNLLPNSSINPKESQGTQEA